MAETIQPAHDYEQIRASMITFEIPVSSSKREEHEPLRGARPLPRDSPAGHAHATAVAARAASRIL